jgi:hypothetical protein
MQGRDVVRGRTLSGRREVDMKVRTFVVAFQCGLVGLTALPAAAGPAEKARLVQQVKDPTSGLEVRVFVGGNADVSIEVGDRTVQIQKQLVRGTAVTRLTTPNERLTLVVDGRSMIADGSFGRLEARSDRPGSREALRRILKSSTAVTRATTLLARLNLGLRSPVGHSLLTTRAMLLAEIGDPSGLQDLTRWVQASRQTLAVTPVAFQGSSPGDCWKEYTKEAIAAYMEVEDCLKDLAWYEIGDKMACATLYDLRAIGAFSWYMKCVALKS